MRLFVMCNLTINWHTTCQRFIYALSTSLTTDWLIPVISDTHINSMWYESFAIKIPMLIELIGLMNHTRYRIPMNFAFFWSFWMNDKIHSFWQFVCIFVCINVHIDNWIHICCVVVARAAAGLLDFNCMSRYSHFREYFKWFSSASPAHTTIMFGVHDWMMHAFVQLPPPHSSNLDVCLITILCNHLSKSVTIIVPAHDLCLSHLSHSLSPETSVKSNLQRINDSKNPWWRALTLSGTYTWTCMIINELEMRHGDMG